ncbi:transposable element Tcb2 transposase [Trichonephila clavipes]|nr:transposable element Tcb2 transposase [Trichonephila clavipes]
MDDNARPHRTLAVEELLESEDITRMDWPAYSPDLHPIEHVWDALGRRIAARLHHPENTQQLKQMLIEEWALLQQEMLHQLVLSMRRRCETPIAALIHKQQSFAVSSQRDCDPENEQAFALNY